MKFMTKKINNTMRKAALMAGMVLLLISCDDFGDTNIDPNNPSEARPELLLTGAQRDVRDVVGSVTGNLWVQYMAETKYNDDSRYANSNANFNGWYTGPLKNLQPIIDLNTDEATRGNALSGGSNANQIAVARILKVYFYQMMTDRWGYIPYSTALQGAENFNPDYDSQEEIYLSLIDELKAAVAQMDGGPGVNGDILFSGDMGQWTIFANSLRARTALRMADTGQSSVAATEFADALSSGVISTDVLYPYVDSADNENPWYSRFRTRTDYALSDVLAGYMKDLGDLRATKYGNPAPDVSNNDGITTLDEIVGMPYNAENPGNITNAAISFPGAAIGAGGPSVGIQNAPLPIITVSEMHFAMAEAVERGWISGSAEQYYLDAIQASWEQWEVFDQAAFDAYVATEEVAYSSENWDEKIGKQKWVALYPNGYEAWAEWRRLGYPELEPHPQAFTEDALIPVRQTYPTTESQINEAAYNAAVSAQGADSPSTHLWWDID